MKERGLRVKLTLEDDGAVSGMIQYVPIEYSLAEGKNLSFINCIWVHGHKQGIGNLQGRGIGKALLEGAETDVRSLGARGMVAWGLIIPVFTRAAWFKCQGYRRVDRVGMQALLWKPFAADAKPPSWIRQSGEPALEPHKVTLTAYCNGWCPAQNIAIERASRAASDPSLSKTVTFREVNTLDRPEHREAGLLGGLFVNRKEVRTGPPPSYEKIHKLISKQAKKVA